MKHTPTPWTLNAGMRPPRIYAHEAPETTICDMANWDIEHWGERLANAELIATAVNAFHGYTGDLANVRAGDFGLLTELLQWTVARLDVDDGMTDKEQKATIARLQPVLSRLTEGGGRE